MRKRIISAAVVLGLGFMGVTLAQQTGQRPQGDEGERPKLRARVVKLRVEIELLELGHATDREYLLDLMRTAKKTDIIPVVLSKLGMADVQESMTVPRTMEEWTALERRALLGDQKAHETFVKLYDAGERANQKGEDAGKAMEAAAKELSITRAKGGDALHDHLDRKRQDFARQASRLAEKRLELAEIEKRYNEAK
jgi:hypothetical protein